MTGGPLRIIGGIEQCVGGAGEERDIEIAGGGIDFQGCGQPARRGNGEFCRMDEGEQFEKIEPGKFGIAEATGDDGGIQQQMWRVRGPADGFAA